MTLGCCDTSVMAEHNWAENYTYLAATIHRPSTIDEARQLVINASRIRVLGTRHSFNDIADSAELLSLDNLPAPVTFDRSAGTVSCSAGMRYGDLADLLRAERVALHNLASLPHISIGGAIATATHGSGVRNGNLATAVAALEMITSNGELLSVSRGDTDFDGMVVGLGALGVVTRVTLDVQPVYDMRQDVFESLAWDTLFEHFDEIVESGYSVSLFTTWGDYVEEVWIKSRLDQDLAVPDGDLFGAVRATVDVHPIRSVSPEHCTAQLGVPGAWSDRLPHFRMEFTPSSGEEIQSEFFVARHDAVAALRAVRELHADIASTLQVSEVRTVAGDTLWMSPQYGNDMVALHFTWIRDPDAVVRAVALIEAALAPFAAIPHWGKVFTMAAATIASRCKRLGDFRVLAERLDPRGAFRNDWFERVLGR